MPLFSSSVPFTPVRSHNISARPLMIYTLCGRKAPRLKLGVGRADKVDNDQTRVHWCRGGDAGRYQNLDLRDRVSSIGAPPPHGPASPCLWPWTAHYARHACACPRGWLSVSTGAPRYEARARGVYIRALERWVRCRRPAGPPLEAREAPSPSRITACPMSCARAGVSRSRRRGAARLSAPRNR